MSKAGLTLRFIRRKSNGKVFSGFHSFYARWRHPGDALSAFREDPTAVPDEMLLQVLWQQQRLRRDALRTLEGQPLLVLHPGFQNHEAGPDFRDAVIRFGDQEPQTGDVEVDLRADCWAAHAHDRNPDYKRVLLHVVWDKPANLPASGPPVLVMRDVLDAPLAELHWWLGSEAAKELPGEYRGQCCEPMRTLEESHRVELLLQAARTRLESKAAQMLARARDAGWEQALWEGLFRALGYKNNAWPMQRLAEIRSRWCGPDREPLALQARLLGIAGLLPAELSRANTDADGYLRQVWDLWWRERDSFSDCILPRAAWRLSNLRPANHPQRRIALAAHWMSAGDLPLHLERWLVNTEAPDKSPARLLSILQCPPDAFWSSHWTLRSARMPRPQPLLGAPRVSDLAVNAILPWLRARTAEGNNDALEKRVEHWYFAWPAGEDNARLRQARLRFLDEGCRHPGTAAVQQGLMQIQRDFCDHSDAACKQCRFPELVRKWKCRSGTQPDGDPSADLSPRSTGRTDC